VPLGENIRNDPKISLYVPLKTLAAAAFFAVEKK
jgi:hypothetical protein